MTFTFSFHGSLQIACNYWQGKICLLFRNILAVHLPELVMGYESCNRKLHPFVLLGLERSHAALLCVGHVFLNSISSVNVEMTEIRSNTPIRLTFCEWFCCSAGCVAWLQKWKGWQCYLISWLNVCEYILYCSPKTPHCLEQTCGSVLGLICSAALIRSIKIFGRGCN